MNETLASEICADLKRSGRTKTVAIVVLAVILGLAALAFALDNRPPKYTVAATVGR